MAGVAAATATAIAADTRLAVTQVRDAVDMPVGHAVMRLREAVQRPEADTAAAHAAGIAVAVVMPVAASAAATVVAAAMAAADTGN
jgi:hypothetical protein